MTKHDVARLLCDPPPANGADLSSRIYSSPDPSPTVLKLMLLLEATGKGVYEDLARAAPLPEVAALLKRNGQEEAGHAYRVKKALAILTGEDFQVPALQDNPYYECLDHGPLTPDMLRQYAASERRGAALYETWAERCNSPEVARLLSLNAKEEHGHCARLEAAAKLLAM